MKGAFWLAIALLPVSAASLDQRPPDDDRVITLVKGTPARDFDSTLPKMRFERWLLDAVGPKAALTWELNDCGEQTGDPETDSKRDIPACVGVYGQLADGRRFNILVSVGTFNKGYAKKPTVRQIAVEWERRIREVKQLRDLPKLLQPSEKK